MDDSILVTVKKILGISADDYSFDTDLFMHINSVFTIIFQLGFGDSQFVIKDPYETWSNFLKDEQNLELIKSYTAMKVRMLFDPPTISSVAEAYKSAISEMEFRISVAVDPKEDNPL